jgi:hypothetical protein
MECIIPEKVSKQVSIAANTLGFEESELVNRAVLFYLDSISSQIELKKEFDFWDELSDEALENFEKEL